MDERRFCIKTERKSLYVAYVDTGKPHIGRADTGDKWTHKRMRKKKRENVREN